MEFLRGVRAANPIPPYQPKIKQFSDGPSLCEIKSSVSNFSSSEINVTFKTKDSALQYAENYYNSLPIFARTNEIYEQIKKAALSKVVSSSSVERSEDQPLSSTKRTLSELNAFLLNIDDVEYLKKNKKSLSENVRLVSPSIALQLIEKRIEQINNWSNSSNPNEIAYFFDKNNHYLIPERFNDDDSRLWARELNQTRHYLDVSNHAKNWNQATRDFEAYNNWVENDPNILDRLHPIVLGFFLTLAKEYEDKSSSHPKSPIFSIDAILNPHRLWANPKLSSKIEAIASKFPIFGQLAMVVNRQIDKIPAHLNLAVNASEKIKSQSVKNQNQSDQSLLASTGLSKKKLIITALASLAALIIMLIVIKPS